ADSLARRKRGGGDAPALPAIRGANDARRARVSRAYPRMSGRARRHAGAAGRETALAWERGREYVGIHALPVGAAIVCEDDGEVTTDFIAHGDSVICIPERH